MSKDKDFREGLFGLEPLNPEMRQRFEQQIRDVVDGKLTRGTRVYWWLLLIVCVIQALFFAYNVTVSPLTVRTTLGLALWLCLATSVAGGVFVATALLRGRVNIRRQLAFGKLLPMIGMIIVFLSFYHGMDDPRKPGAAWFGVYAVAVLVLTSGISLWNRIVAADLHSQEHLLRLEYRLADLASRLPPGGHDQASE